MQSSPPPEPKRLVGLDAVRGLAIALVVICHYFRDRILDGVPNIIVGPFGLAGVTLFFMLSGFLIERHLTRDPTLLRYLSRRVFRIMPAYLVCLAVILVIEAVRPDGKDWTLRELFINAVLLQDVFGAPLMLAVVWTLLIEIKFYALAPLITYAGPLALRLAPWLAMGLNCLILFVRGEASTLLTYLTFCLIGMQFGPWLRREMAGGTLAASVLTAAVAAYFFAGYYALGLAIFVVIDALFMTIGLKLSTPVPPMAFLGRISYGLYLYHVAIGYPIIVLIGGAFTGTPGATIIAVALAAAASLAAAWLSFVAIEQPMIAFGLKCERYANLATRPTSPSDERQPV